MLKCAFCKIGIILIDSKLNLLILCDRPRENYSANTIVDHIDSFELYSKHKIFVFSNLGKIPNEIDLNKFDIIVIHYSLSLLRDHYIPLSGKDKIRAFGGLKVLFVQDEYRSINKMIEAIDYLGIDILFTCFPESEMHRIYTKQRLPHLTVHNNLTGYIPERLLNGPAPIPMNERQFDVGYRGRQLPFWYGELGYEKSHIVDAWLSKTQGAGLKSNVSYHEQDRIYGDNWITFIRSCKVMLGVESGASVMDFTGELEKQVDFYQLTHPEASFHDVQALFLKDYEGQYYLNQISPRCFEAIALKTGLVLFEGQYSGILQPHEHYIPLKKNFSNIESVISAIKDDALLEDMTMKAYQDIALNPDYHYAGFIKQVDMILECEFLTRKKTCVQNPYTGTSFSKAVSMTESWKKKLFRTLLSIYQRLPYQWRLIIKCLFRPRIGLLYLRSWFYKMLYSVDLALKRNKKED